MMLQCRAINFGNYDNNLKIGYKNTLYHKLKISCLPQYSVEIVDD